MAQQTINPDVICQQAIQAKLNVYQTKEHFESVLKKYNDHVDNLLNLISIMKNRIVELEKQVEGEIGESRLESSVTLEK